MQLTTTATLTEDEILEAITDWTQKKMRRKAIGKVVLRALAEESGVVTKFWADVEITEKKDDDDEGRELK